MTTVRLNNDYLVPGAHIQAWNILDGKYNEVFVVNVKDVKTWKSKTL